MWTNCVIYLFVTVNGTVNIMIAVKKNQIASVPQWNMSLNFPSFDIIYSIGLRQFSSKYICTLYLFRHSARFKWDKEKKKWPRKRQKGLKGATWSIHLMYFEPHKMHHAHVASQSHWHNWWMINWFMCM